MDKVDPDPTFRGLMATCQLAHEHHIAQKLSGSPNPAAAARCLLTFRQQICELRDLLNNGDFFAAITADENGDGAHLSRMDGAHAFGLAMGIKPSDDDYRIESLAHPPAMTMAHAPVHLTANAGATSNPTSEAFGKLLCKA